MMTAPSTIALKTLWLSSLAALCAYLACSPGTGIDGDADSDSDGDTDAAREVCDDERDNDGDSMVDCVDPDCISHAHCQGGDGDADSDIDMSECASVNVAADNALAPVDIIWVIDSSGSMHREAVLVQDNMNAFVEAISAADVDYHVVVMTDRNYVDVPPPLGDDLERYLFIQQPIWSTESLNMLQSNFSRYSFFLRPRGATHIIAVSDDETSTEPANFLRAMTDLIGHEFTFHAVASEVAFHSCSEGSCPGCEGPDGEAANIGARYYELAEMTGGHQFSICASDWTALFDTLRESIVLSAELPCFYDLPEPPPGLIFDPDLVNVVFTDASGAEQTLARAMSPDVCDDHEAWYFDDNTIPTRIELCPEACDLVQSVSHGEVDIALGCEPGEIIY